MRSRIVAALGVVLIGAGIVWAQPGDVLPPEPSFIVHRVMAKEVADARKARVHVLRWLFPGRVRAISRFNRIDVRFVRAGSVLRIPLLARGETAYTPLPSTYNATIGLNKAVVIVLDLQFLGAYEQGTLTASYPISSGRAGFETPSGRFLITKKDIDHASSVYPEETNGGWPMPFALRFHRSEYWIHEGDLKGFPDSHGCVRLLPGDAKKLFDWAEVGTPVRVFSSYPL